MYLIVLFLDAETAHISDIQLHLGVNIDSEIV